MSGSGGEAPYNRDRPGDRRGHRRQLEGAGAQHDLLPVRRSEVRFILVYGRPFSPMSPWGVDGGGPMNDQQIDTLIAYMHSIQIDREDCGER